ncbi:MAG: hypothetical protein IKW68_05260 [Clostridia bacterium]|nr:hypothetical protein [Clostridia bacterium]
MVALYIVSILIIVIALLLMTKVKLRLLSDGDLRLKVGVGPFMVTLLPSKQKKIKLRDFTHKKYLKKLQLLRQEKERLAAEAEAKKLKKQAEKESGENKLSGLTDFIMTLLSKYEKYTGRLNTEVKRLDVSVGGKDASAAAISYAVYSQAVAYILEILESKTKMKPLKEGRVNVVCDWFSDKTDVSADVVVKIKVWDAIVSAVEILMLKIQHSNKNVNNNSESEDHKNGREQTERDH